MIPIETSKAKSIYLPSIIFHQDREVQLRGPASKQCLYDLIIEYLFVATIVHEHIKKVYSDTTCGSLFWEQPIVLSSSELFPKHSKDFLYLNHLTRQIKVYLLIKV